MPLWSALTAHGLPPDTQQTGFALKHFTAVGAGVDVDPILAEIDANEAMFGSFDARQRAPGTPHAQTTDIWLRGPDPEQMAADPAWVNRPHLSVFWPAWFKLPSLHGYVLGPRSLSAHIGATGIGAILITRMAPGTRIEWHTDAPYWHAREYNPKLYLPLRSNDGCVNYVEDERLVMAPGSVWSFDNMKMHAVENNGDAERIMAIICLRTT